MKITFVGAGSTVFAKTLLGDLMSFPEFSDGATIALTDIDEERLRSSASVARKIVDAVGANVRVQSTLERRVALDGADYVVTMMQVGGYRPATVTDFEVPKRFGLRQTIGDTLGIGGSCAASGRSRSCWTSAATWRTSARTPTFSSTSIRWQCSPGPSRVRARFALSACATPFRGRQAT
jgi:alpha-galactosidase/6-phospho-beta-glucosidase family protein